MLWGLGADQGTVAAVVSCPPCSYLVEGTCVVCAPMDPHPACRYCETGEYRPPKPPWWKNELLLAIVSATVVATASSLITVRLQSMLERRARQRG